MFNPKDLANLLKKLRRKSGISRNQLAKLTGLSRRTLARIESGVPNAQRPKLKAHRPGLSPRTAFKLARALLGEDATQRALDDSTRLSRFLGDDPLYKYLDVLYHYPAFLFHRSAAETLSAVEGPTSFRQYADDYRHSLDLLLRSGFGTRNLGARLRAFRMQHDLTLVETADLLDLSKSELHRLERAERRPSPRVRYRILRLLTLPVGFAGQPSCPERSRRVRADMKVAARRASSEGSQGNPRRVSPPPAAGGPTLPVRRLRNEPAADTPLAKTLAGSAGLKPRPTKSAARVAWLAAVRAALAAPPPRSDAPSSAETLSGAEGLRQFWLAGPLKTKELAAALGVSQPHLIRLLRGDRRPSKKLTERLESLLGTARQVPKYQVPVRVDGPTGLRQSPD